MKVILQHDERDCGAACLSMIASYYKLFLPISKCRELTKTDRFGTNLYGLTNGAKQIGLEAKALSGSREELEVGLDSKEIVFPFIAHVVNENAMLHYVVVCGKQNGGFVICDPAQGKKVLDNESFYQKWTGYVVTFTKMESFKTGNYTRGAFLKFFQLLKGQWIKLSGILMASLIIAMIGILGAFVFQVVIDNITTEQGYYSEHNHTHEEMEVVDASGEKSTIDLILEYYSQSIAGHFDLIFSSLILLYLLQAVIRFLRGWLIICIYRTIDLRLTLKYYNHIVDLPMSSFSVRQTGEYLSRFSDSASIRQAISGATLTLLLDSIMAIAGGAILFMESEVLFAVSLGMVFLYSIILLLYRKPVEQSNRCAMEENAQLQSFFKESIDGMEFIKASNAGTQIKETTTKRFNRFLDAMVKRSIVFVSQETIAGTVELIGTVLILWIGFAMVRSGMLTIGKLITFYALLTYFTEPIKNLIELQPTIQTAFVAADRLDDILNLETEEVSDYNECVNEEMPTNVQSWEAKNVYFRYGNHELTLHDVNFRINQGERIAIVGESGSGKTSLAKLFLRFYEPESGELTLDGTNIRNYCLETLRNIIAYVGQNTFMFSDTIRNNLSLGNPSISDEELQRVCELSKTIGFIRNLPFEYDTPIDENGKMLSDGQRQRLAIARALARNPQLLILDEATSSLDTVTESEIRDTIFNLDKKMSCIIIAHRLSTIRSCDRIYVMKDGTFVETGTYDELIQKQGEFFRLWNAQ